MDNQTKKKPIWLIAGIATIVVLAIVLVIVMITKGSGKGGATGLVGKWVYERASMPYVYDFKSDGTGTYSMKNSEGTMQFKYKTNVAKDGDTVVLDDDGKQIPVIEFMYNDDEEPSMILKYRFDGDDKLIIVDSFGNDTVYNREK